MAAARTVHVRIRATRLTGPRTMAGRAPGCAERAIQIWGDVEVSGKAGGQSNRTD